MVMAPVETKTPGRFMARRNESSVTSAALTFGGGCVVNRRQAVFVADDVLDLHRDRGVLAQELLGVFAPLADRLALVAEERATLFDHAQFGRDVENIARLADA